MSSSPSSEEKKSENESDNNNEKRPNLKDDKNRLDKKLLDVNRGKYKFYKGSNIYKNNENKNDSIIIEVTEREGVDEKSLNSNLKMSIMQPVNTKTNSSKNVSTNKFSNKNVHKNRSHTLKKKIAKKILNLNLIIIKKLIMN